MPSFSAAEAQLVSQLLQPIFYGIYVVTLGFCLKSLLRAKGKWKPLNEINKPMLFAAVLMGIIATFDVFLTFAINLHAFVYYDGPGGPGEAFNATSSWMNVMSALDVILQTIIGDSILIYRCYVVYSRSWLVIALPLALAIGGLVLVGLSIYYMIALPNGSQLMSPYKEVVISTWAVTIAINVVTTSLIVYRIWRVNRTNAKVMNGNTSSSGNESRLAYHQIMRIIVESGMLYTIVATIASSAYIAGSNAFAPMSAVDVEVIGIAFNLIIIRVDRRSQTEVKQYNAKPRSSSLRFGSIQVARPTETTLSMYTGRGLDDNNSEEVENHTEKHSGTSRTAASSTDVDIERCSSRSELEEEEDI